MERRRGGDRRVGRGTQGYGNLETCTDVGRKLRYYSRSSHGMRPVQACRDLNNLSSTSAFVIALLSPIVAELALTRESKADEVLCALDTTDGVY